MAVPSRGLNMRSQILAGAIQGADNFNCTFSDGSYIIVALEAQYSLHGASSREHPFILSGGSSGSDV